METAVFAVLIAIAPAVRLAAQQPSAPQPSAPQPSPPPAQDVIQVTARGEYQADPDTAVIEFLVTGEEGELRYAYAKAQAQADQVRELLRSQGFPPEAAQVGAYAVVPNLDRNSHRVIDYTVSAVITLDLTDFTKLGPLLDQAGASGLNALRSLSFILKNQDAARAAAIADGYRQAHQEALALAEAAGLHLEGLAYASVDVNASPIRPLTEFALATPRAGPEEAPVSQFTPQPITVSAAIDAWYRVRY